MSKRKATEEETIVDTEKDQELNTVNAAVTGKKRKQTKHQACIHACCKAYANDCASFSLPSGPSCDRGELKKYLEYLGRDEAYISKVIQKLKNNQAIRLRACKHHFQDVVQRNGQKTRITLFEKHEIQSQDPLYKDRLHLRVDVAWKFIQESEATTTKGTTHIARNESKKKRRGSISKQRVQEFVTPDVAEKLETDNVELRRQVQKLTSQLKKSTASHHACTIQIENLQQDLLRSKNSTSAIYSYEILCTKSDDFIYKIIGFRSVLLFKDIVQMHVRRLLMTVKSSLRVP